MDQLISARWATDKEKADFYKWLSSKNVSKNEFTNNWMANNGELLIQLHNRFADDMFVHKKEQHKQNQEEYKRKHEQKLLEYENRKANLQKCVCFGNEVVREFSDYELIGCDNWMASGFDHTKIYKPKFIPSTPNEDWFIFEASTSYISQLRDFYSLPKELKISILIEYLLMNNVQLLNEDAKKGQLVAPESSRDSKKREQIVKSQLESKCDKVIYQKMIKATFEKSGNKTLIPDFILVKGDNLYLVEQKKREDLINIDQINNYLQCLKYLSKRDYNISYFVIVEFGDTDLDRNIINFQDLNTYELI